MGPEGAVNIIFRNELAQAKDSTEARQKLVADYRDNFLAGPERRPAGAARSNRISDTHQVG